ncbi:protein-disulfide reductase DsbD [Enterobacteriaceae bacterium LUAb1]
MINRILFFILISISQLLYASTALFEPNPVQQFVPASQAFAFDFSQQQNQLILSWKIKPGYYLYRQQFKLTPEKARMAPVTLPAGETHEDAFFGKTEIYRQDLQLPLTLLSADQEAILTVTWQGCAASGFCYPPETRRVPLSAVSANTTSGASPTAGNTVTDLPFSPLWALLIGFGVAFTPCVLPMYPLISGIILGGGHRHTVRRVLTLAISYVQGMALTYTIMGLLVAAAGLRFQAALQSPVVLISLSVLFILLALSMFGLFTLQLPASLQTRLTLLSNRQQGGSLPGVFLMGALAGLICSPCTTAPLSAILLYIAQSGNLAVGAGTLYLYALGMGLPLILVMIFGNKLLPKRGPWMQTVKEGFGFIILALPIFLLGRITDEIWALRLWSLLLVSFFCWLFISLINIPRGWGRLLQIASLVAALIAGKPMQEWVFGHPSPASQPSHLNFTQVSHPQQIQQALQAGNAPITMLDFYADWCVACKAFDNNTFTSVDVQSTLQSAQLLQANVTANTPADAEMLKSFQVLGLPTILFFDHQGREIPGSRVTGFMDAQHFSKHLQKIMP